MRGPARLTYISARNSRMIFVIIDITGSHQTQFAENIMEYNYSSVHRRFYMYFELMIQNILLSVNTFVFHED
jgi:hypothetical protein